MSDEYAYRFEYADKSAFVVYPDGRAFITFPDGRPPEQKFGNIDNRIPSMIGRVAKPRQDEIERLTIQLVSKQRSLQWIVNSPRAPPSNMVAVARHALTDDKGTS